MIVDKARVLGWRARHSRPHYTVAKAEVMALTRCSAIEAVARHKFLDKTTLAELLDRLSAREAYRRAA